MKINTYTPKKFKNKYTTERKGKYTQGENDYLELLIDFFIKGALNIPNNYPMRIFLANCLGRDPMCISKKYKGSLSIGKKRYFIKNISSNIYIADFKNKQNIFLKSLSNSKNILIPTLSKILEKNIPNNKPNISLDYIDNLEEIIPFIPKNDFSDLLWNFDI